MDPHDVTEQDVIDMRLGMGALIAMVGPWQAMLDWIKQADSRKPASVEKFDRYAKDELELKLAAADARAAEIESTLADFTAKIAQVRAVVKAANVYVEPERIEPIRVAEKAPEAVKDKGVVLESSRIEGKFGDSHLTEIKKMKNGGIEEWVDGEFYKTIHDYADRKAAKALQAATEATERLKRQNRWAEDEKRRKEAEEREKARADEEWERGRERRDNESKGYYNLLHDAGSRQETWEQKIPPETSEQKKPERQNPETSEQKKAQAARDDWQQRRNGQ